MSDKKNLPAPATKVGGKRVGHAHKHAAAASSSDGKEDAATPQTQLEAALAPAPANPHNPNANAVAVIGDDYPSEKQLEANPKAVPSTYNPPAPKHDKHEQPAAAKNIIKQTRQFNQPSGRMGGK